MRPDNPIAARIQAGIAGSRYGKSKQLLAVKMNPTFAIPMCSACLVFLQRLEMQKNNRRRKSRAFIDFLREFFPPEPAKQESSLIIT